MHDHLSFPVTIAYCDRDQIPQILSWAEKSNLSISIKGDIARRSYAVNCTTSDGRPVQQILEAIKKVVGITGESRATFSAIRNYSFLRTSVTAETTQWALDELCRTGELIKIDAVDGRTGKPLPRYKLGESE